MLADRRDIGPVEGGGIIEDCQGQVIEQAKFVGSGVEDLLSVFEETAQELFPFCIAFVGER